MPTLTCALRPSFEAREPIVGNYPTASLLETGGRRVGIGGRYEIVGRCRSSRLRKPFEQSMVSALTGFPSRTIAAPGDPDGTGRRQVATGIVIKRPPGRLHSPPTALRGNAGKD